MERVQVLYSWKHSGFNLHAGEQVPPEAKADLEALAQHILRNPFSVQKMTMESRSSATWASGTTRLHRISSYQ